MLNCIIRASCTFINNICIYFRYVRARAEKFDDQHSKTASAISQVRPAQPSLVIYWPADDVDSPSSNVPDERTAYTRYSLTPFEIASSNSAHSFVDFHWSFNLNVTIFYIIYNITYNIHARNKYIQWRAYERNWYGKTILLALDKNVLKILYKYIQ